MTNARHAVVHEFAPRGLAAGPAPNSPLEEHPIKATIAQILRFKWATRD